MGRQIERHELLAVTQAPLGQRKRHYVINLQQVWVDG